MQVRNLGKPVDLAGQYYKDGADEVCFLVISGSNTALFRFCLLLNHSPFGFSD